MPPPARPAMWLLLVLPSIVGFSRRISDESLPFGDPHHARQPFRLKPPALQFASATSIALTWIPPDEDGGSPIIGYALYGGVTGGPIHPLYDPLRAGDVVDPQKRDFTVHGLYPATNYSFQVAVDNERGRSMFSELASFRTTPIVPIVSSAAVSYTHLTLPTILLV